jgi:hypothetical protein
VRQALIDAVGGWGLYTVAEIADLFSDEGFSRTSETTAFAGGARRQEAEAYQADINYSHPDQVERYLHVLEKVLDDHADAKDDDTRKRYERLAKALKRADIAADERGHLRLPAHRALGVPSLAAVPTESGIRLQLDRLGRLEQEPEEMIGAAKELVEATAKHVLLELGEELPENADLPGLSKLALAKLRLHPKAIAPTTKGSEVMAKILSSLGQTAGGLAELRNLGYGTGHGAGLRVKGLGRRHAEFAARAAIAYTTFVLDTLNDPDAPWRSAGDT